ncbi:integrase [Haematobacter missouriensis]|uniref:Integrase n=1 Tax=Haematobacter missouriensis TaxID=366616 RepID=A0A212APW5_9RHOB|nr:site-specific integrase [Haematobacter missouriensis]KFI30987.1 integrase [Haematobacter missouriensis]OWJ73927.1 integrase [Haematobacter missouriensis]OWJ83537.1 integrase [Haematobacter missouriensis]
MREYSVGRLNGRFVVTWDDNGKRRRFRLSALTRKEAEAEALTIIRRETRGSKAQKTVRAVWQDYCDEHAGRPATSNMSFTGLPILAHFGALLPDQITGQHCRDYAESRTAEGRKVGTIWTELGHLSTALNWAAKARIIDRAPHIVRPKKPAPKDRYLTRDEIDRLLSTLETPHIRLAVILMLSTAARIGAILDLTWDRVDEKRGRIDLRRDMDGPRKGRAVVPINPGLRASLLSARESAQTEYVIEYAGAPVRSIRTGLQSACKKAKLTGVTPHVFRHTAAVHMAEAGVPMSAISQYLGHSSTSITERVYARYSPEYLADAALAVDFVGIRSVK